MHAIRLIMQIIHEVTCTYPEAMVDSGAVQDVLKAFFLKMRLLWLGHKCAESLYLILKSPNIKNLTA